VGIAQRFVVPLVILTLLGVGAALLLTWSRTDGPVAQAVPSPPVHPAVAPEQPVRRHLPAPWPQGQSPKAPLPGAVSETRVSEPSDGHRRMEETGPDLAEKTPDELIASLADADPRSRGRAAWELGNRFLSQAWAPTPAQQDAVDAVAKRLVDEGNPAVLEAYAASREQLYRLWSLGHPALLRALDPSGKNLDLIIKTLAATRTRALVETLVRQYRSEADPDRKRLLAFTLSCMKEQRRVPTPRRQVMGARESAALYDELIAPMLDGR